MKRILFLWIIASCISGCSTLSVSRPDLLSLPQDEIIELNAIAAVPLDIAYQNIFDRARQCWHSVYSGEVEANPLDQKTGFARVSFNVPGRLVGSRITLTNVYLFPEPENGTRLMGRNFSFAGEWDGLKLKNWAEGQDTSC